MAASRLSKEDPPRSSGIFKPVGHVLMAFEQVEQAQSARDALLAGGFDALDLVGYSPDEMRALVDEDLQQAGALASMGSEINLARRHRQLALSGYHFLVVYAPDDEITEKVRQIAISSGAVLAQKYNRLIIEELIAPDGSPRA